MSGSATAKTPATYRSLDKFFRYSGEPKVATDLNFEFLDENLEFSETSFHSITNLNTINIVNKEDDPDEENSGDTEENKAFWESKEELLQANISRTNFFESEIRKATKEAIKELKLAVATCTCRKTVSGICRRCMQKEISQRLQNSGYNCIICKSKWKSYAELPGEHTYMEVVQQSSSKKGAVKVIIELNFRGEFEMSRAISEEYNRLVQKLPEVYVGKVERLQSLIKILCSASKKCMQSKKMHLAPWRKHKYMQAKWLGSPELKPEDDFPVKYSEERQLPPQRPRASMLTFDLLDSLPAMYFTPAIRVV